MPYGMPALESSSKAMQSTPSPELPSSPPGSYAADTVAGLGGKLARASVAGVLARRRHDRLARADLEPVAEVAEPDVDAAHAGASADVAGVRTAVSGTAATVGTAAAAPAATVAAAAAGAVAAADLSGDAEDVRPDAGDVRAGGHVTRANPDGRGVAVASATTARTTAAASASASRAVARAAAEVGQLHADTVTERRRAERSADCDEAGAAATNAANATAASAIRMRIPFIAYLLGGRATRAAALRSRSVSLYVGKDALESGSWRRIPRMRRPVSQFRAVEPTACRKASSTTGSNCALEAVRMRSVASCAGSASR